MLDQRAARTKPELTSEAPAAQLLLAWYDLHRRLLPWRALPGLRPDPYAVWLSEIMLQQTTVAAVKAYYARFLARWPTVGALAAAPVAAVMQEWAGLGYYSRARNLHACAGAVVRDYGGRFSRDAATLERLPGIGAYTAAAIAAIAFDEKVVVIDANVERVIARLFAVAVPLPKAKPVIRMHAAALTPDARPGDYAQAMMDLGATICTPRRPACVLCPLAESCAARLRGDPQGFPRKLPKAPRPRRFGAAFWVRRADGHVLVRTRPEKGLLGGMTEFPGNDWTSNYDEAAALHSAPLPVPYRLAQTRVAHVFTHFALELRVFTGEAANGCSAPDGHRWVAGDRLDDEALPTLMRKIMAAAQGVKLEKRHT